MHACANLFRCKFSHYGEDEIYILKRRKAAKNENPLLVMGEKKNALAVITVLFMTSASCLDYNQATGQCKICNPFTFFFRCSQWDVTDVQTF